MTYQEESPMSHQNFSTDHTLQWVFHHPQWILHLRLPRGSEHQGHMCTYPTRIEYAGTGHIPIKQVKIQNLCTYPLRIEHAGTSYRICAHILQEFYMQALHIELVHISQGNWTCKHSRRGRDRDRDQGHPEARALLKQVKIEMEKTSIT